MNLRGINSLRLALFDAPLTPGKRISRDILFDVPRPASALPWPPRGAHPTARAQQAKQCYGSPWINDGGGGLREIDFGGGVPPDRLSRP